MVADAGLDYPDDATRLYQVLERVSSCLAQATEEGRAALSALRSSATQRNDLAEALERAGRHEEFAAPIAFLLSGAASYVTGALLNIDGGTDF